MPEETLEEIRLLSNLESNRHKLLQIVLFGQPELDEHLDTAGMRQLKERITHSFRLEPLVRSDIENYIDFRMRAAGYRGPKVFTPRAVKVIAKTSQGLTRRINILADKALLAAFADGTHAVNRRGGQEGGAGLRVLSNAGRAAKAQDRRGCALRRPGTWLGNPHAASRRATAARIRIGTIPIRIGPFRDRVGTLPPRDSILPNWDSAAPDRDSTLADRNSAICDPDCRHHRRHPSGDGSPRAHRLQSKFPHRPESDFSGDRCGKRGHGCDASAQSCRERYGIGRARPAATVCGCSRRAGGRTRRAERELGPSADSA